MIARQLRPCLTVFWCLLGPGLAGNAAAAPDEQVTETQVAATPSPTSVSLDAVRQFVKDGPYADAEQAARELLNRTERIHGKDSVESAEVLVALAEAMRRGGKTMRDETLEVAQRAVTINENAPGPPDERLAAALSELAEVYRARGGNATARPLLERSLAIYETTHGTDGTGAAGAHLSLGFLLRTLGDFEGAEAHLREALRIYEATDGPDSVNAAVTIRGFAGLAWDRGELAEAEGLYRSSLEVLERSLGPSHEKVGDCLASLGLLHHNAGEFELSRTELLRALEILQSALGPDHPKLVPILGNLWLAEGALGLPSSRLNDAIALGDRVLGPQHPVTAVYRANLAVALGSTDPAEAIELWQQALPVFETSYGPESARVYWALDGLGSCLLRMGDYEAAGRYIEQAVAGWEKQSDQSPGLHSGLLRDLAEHREATGQAAEARQLYARALAIDEATLGPDHPTLAGALRDYGSQLMRSGDLDGARAAFERALSISLKAFGPDHHDTGWSLFKLAELETAAGRLDEALRLFPRSLRLLRGLWGSGTANPEEANGEREYAACLLRSGDAGGALAAAERAEDIRRDFLRATVASLPERQALGLAMKSPQGIDLEISAAASASDSMAATAAHDALIRSRAIVLDEIAYRYHTTWLAHDQETQQLVAAYGAASATFANLTVRGLDERFPERSMQRFQAARAEKEAAEHALAERSTEFRATEARSQAGLQEVETALPGGSALVSFVRYARQPSGPHAPSSHAPVDSYAAFVLRADATASALVDLGAASEIDEMIGAFRARIADGSQASGAAMKAAEASYRRAGEDLRRRVWDQVEPHLDGVETVFIVPDGALNLVNLAALPVGTSEYLVEKRHRIHYLSAERDLVGADTVAGSGLLAVGNPAFDEETLFATMRPANILIPDKEVRVASGRLFRGQPSSCGNFKALHFEPLPSSKPEVEDVASTWGAAPSAAGHTLRGAANVVEAQVLEGAGANELAVKVGAPGKDVLHLATHGFFLGEGCPSALDASSGATGQPLPALYLSENPLLLSGLALAGANHREAAGPDEDDGILTAQEIAAMNLSGVEWAVLSACDTGLGQIRAGEGVLGLRRAFQVAGARTVIMSLWPVEDEASRQWMRTLYTNRMAKGMSTVDAVNAASLEQLRQRRDEGLSTHPFYWAGFVATGDWR